jgi:hypothetical protein
MSNQTELSEKSNEKAFAFLLFHSIFQIVQFGYSLLFFSFYCLSFLSFSAHMYIYIHIYICIYPPLYSADDEISTSNHSLYISLYIASICKPEDGL